ncbi:hypothetical protein Taro_026241 [Colocasia esculenta]|uniref:Uncharacterized protein n=1 Tax=Colocasia esculenta TaxID=4460 RepID=A0A843VAW8_COLES|nr:hypothetical protein [Colocasia esculenta]
MQAVVVSRAGLRRLSVLQADGSVAEKGEAFWPLTSSNTPSPFSLQPPLISSVCYFAHPNPAPYPLSLSLSLWLQRGPNGREQKSVAPFNGHLLLWELADRSQIREGRRESGGGEREDLCRSASHGERREVRSAGCYQAAAVAARTAPDQYIARD